MSKVKKLLRLCLGAVLSLLVALMRHAQKLVIASGTALIRILIKLMHSIYALTRLIAAASNKILRYMSH